MLWLIFCGLILHSCNNEHFSNTLIYGVWQGAYDNEIIELHFNKNRTCLLIIKDKKLRRIEELTGNYVIDFSKKPIPLSIRNIPKRNFSLHTIIKLIQDDSIKIALFAKRWKLRPIAFSSGTSIILKRLKENNSAN